MKTCEECGDEYEENLQHCPHCAMVKLEAKTDREIRLLRDILISIGILVLAVILAAGLYMYTNRRAPTRSPSSIAASFAAIRTAPSPSSDASAWAPVNGEAIVTLTVHRNEMGGSARASDAAHGVARIILGSVPAASSVAVFDGDGSLIGRYQR